LPIGAAALAIAVFGLAGCDQKPMPPAATPVSVAASSPDLYDPAEMDFKPGPAALTASATPGRLPPAMRSAWMPR
jgi:hypothetical protein